MQDSQIYMKELLVGFIRHTSTPEQVETLYRFIAQAPDAYRQLMLDPDIVQLARENAARPAPLLRPAADQRILEQLRVYADHHREAATASPAGKIVPLPNRRWKPVAAAVLVAGVAVAAIFYTGRTHSGQPLALETPVADIHAPAATKATIQLADGTKVPVDSLQKGLLARQGNVQLVKLGNGQVSYRAAPGETAIRYNTLANPRGSGVVDMLLSDGSHVWLNAGSTLTYPVAFPGGERKVTLQGEAYFEIAQDPSRPFYVSKGNTEIRVLGTHFNMNAYDDDTEIKVTLLEGAVSVANGSPATARQEVVLKPGQQALAGAQSGKPQVLSHVDVEAVTAWKEGFFNFNKVALEDVMRQLSRWYDVEIVYQGVVQSRMLGGEMQRNLNLSDVLDGLKDIGVHCKIEGRKIIVMP